MRKPINMVNCFMLRIKYILLNELKMPVQISIIQNFKNVYIINQLNIIVRTKKFKRIYSRFSTETCSRIFYGEGAIC